MTSAAQVLANRSNARKSTGPRTPEGKAAASRNAVKHGLLAEQVVIHGEDPAEFDLYRAGMLAELAPVGAVEALLAERAVSLSWRLRRAERLQSAVFATVYRENANDVVLWPKHGLPIQPGPDEDEVVLGQVVMTDFLHAKVLDRLLVYERRIESSLYRTMAQLRREREARGVAAEAEGVSRLEGGLPAGQEAAAPVKLASFGADTAEETASAKWEASDATCEISSDSSDFALQTSHIERAKITPYGVTTNAPAGGNHEQDAHATRTGHVGQIHGRDARATGTPCGVATNDEGRATQSSAETLHPSRFTIDPAKRTQFQQEGGSDWGKGKCGETG
jgi:hypothetical protein